MRRFAIYPILVLCMIITIGCNGGPNQPTVVMPAQVSAKAKRYRLKGKVVSVDKQAHMVNIDGEDIPGFMPAMTMPYLVKPESDLDKLSLAESITADVVVQDDKSWLENIAVTGQSAAPPSK